MKRRVRSTVWAAVLAAASASACCEGQTVANWVAGLGGDYNDDAAWQVGAQAAGAPGSTPDSINESARFALGGAYTVSLSPGDDTTVAGIAFDGFAIVTLTLDGSVPMAGDASLSAAGDVVVDATLVVVSSPAPTLNNAGGDAGGELELSAGHLRIGEGGRLATNGAASINATRTTIGRGSLSQPSSLRLWSPGEHSLGGVSIGETGPTGRREGELSLTNNAIVQAGDLSVAANGGDAAGSISVAAATLNQIGAATLRLGAADGTGDAGLLVDPGGVVNTGTGGVTVHAGGRVVNDGGEVHFGGDLLIDGGSYTETSLARRSFATDAALRVEAGGGLLLGDEPLTLDGSQTLSVTGAGSELVGSGDFLLGPDAALHIELAADENALPPIRFDGEADLAGGLSVRFSDGATPSLGTVAELVSAGSFDRLPTLVDAPPLAPGLAWELETSEGLLRLVAVRAAPEPAAWWLLLAGLFAVLPQRRARGPHGC